MPIIRYLLPLVALGTVRPGGVKSKIRLFPCSLYLHIYRTWRNSTIPPTMAKEITRFSLCLYVYMRSQYGSNYIS